MALLAALQRYSMAGLKPLVQCINTPRYLDSSACSTMSPLKRKEGMLDFWGSKEEEEIHYVHTASKGL